MNTIKNTQAFRTGFAAVLDARSLTPTLLFQKAEDKGVKPFPSERTIRRMVNGKTEKVNKFWLIQIAEALELSYPTLLEEISERGSHALSEEGSKHRHDLGIPRLWFIAIPVALSLALLWVWQGEHLWTMRSPQSSIRYLELSSDKTRIVVIDEAERRRGTINVGAEVVQPLLIEVGGEQYVVVGVRGQGDLLEAGYVMAYDIRGEEKWRFSTYDAEFLKQWYRLLGFPERTGNGYFVVDWLGRAPFFGESKEYIVVLAGELDFAATRITILEPSTGKGVYTFWHDGAINGGNVEDTGMKITDLNEDGSSEILVPGWLNGFTNEINRKLSMPIDSAYWTATWMLEPTKGMIVCPPARFCSQEPFKWLVLSHPFKKIPSIGIVREEGILGVKIGYPGLGLYNTVNYEGTVVEWFRGPAWKDQFGDVAPPPILFLRGTEQGLKAEVESEYPVSFDSTMRRIYHERDVQRAREFLRLYKYEDFL